MRVVSLFSGIGGFDEGFRRAGFDILAACEINADCRKVLRRHFPETEIYNDVKEITRGTFAGRAIDVLVGGFPCQDLSVAGRRAGLAGERSGLWFEFVRIIGDYLPRWIVVENVPGLLSSNGGADFAVILRGLVELGYGVAWRVLDAQYFGLAQRRERVFIVASLRSGSAAQVLFESEGGGWNPAPRRETGERVAATLTAGIGAGRGVNAPGQRREDDVNLVSFTQNTRDEVRHINGDGSIVGALPAQPGAKQQSYLLAFGGGSEHLIAGAVTSEWAKGTGGPSGDECQNLIAHTLRAEGHDASEDGTGRGTPLIVTPELAIPLTASGRGTERTGESRGQDTLILGFNGKASVTQSMNPSEIAPSLDVSKAGGICAFTERTRAEGRTVEAQDELAYSLTDGSKGGNPHSGKIAGGFGVRRLTPTECERLQGFPDSWTACGHDGKAMSDSARYRMLGNAVCVPTVEWIARRIMANNDSAEGRGE